MVAAGGAPIGASAVLAADEAVVVVLSLSLGVASEVSGVVVVGMTDSRGAAAVMPAVSHVSCTRG